MKNHLWLPFVLVATAIAVVALFPARGQAACPPTDVPAQFSAADVVVTGAVYSIVSLDEGGSEVYLDPVTIYKGADLVNDSLIVAVPAKPVDVVAFAEGDEPYLLFLQAQNDETFATSTCAGSRKLGAGLTEAEKTVLGAGTDYAATPPPLTEGDQQSAESAVDTVSPSTMLVEERAATWVSEHRPVTIALVLWLLLTHGGALWAAGRLNQRGWFVALFLVPSVGLLPIVYLGLFGKDAFRPTGQTSKTNL